MLIWLVVWSIFVFFSMFFHVFFHIVGRIILFDSYVSEGWPNHHQQWKNFDSFGTLWISSAPSLDGRNSGYMAFPGKKFVRTSSTCESEARLNQPDVCSSQLHILSTSFQQLSGWWFGTFFIFPYISIYWVSNHPN